MSKEITSEELARHLAATYLNNAAGSECAKLLELYCTAGPLREKVIDGLMQLIFNDDAALSKKAISLLGLIKAKKAESKLIQFFDDHFPRKRLMALVSLPRHTGKECQLLVLLIITLIQIKSERGEKIAKEVRTMFSQTFIGRSIRI